MPASNDHNSGRLIFGPDLKLYYSFGDQGYNQFGNACLSILAQNLPNSAADYANYPGKILRINTDGSVPVDNPVLAGVQSHVYTYGHRNPQGLVFAQDGTLYSSEHGAKVDDELNKIIPGKIMDGHKLQVIMIIWPMRIAIGARLHLVMLQVFQMMFVRLA